MKKSKFEVGQTHGYLTLIEDTGERKHNGHKIFKCQCVCGKIIYRAADMIAQSLKKNCVISCGCMKPKSTVGRRELNNPIRIERQKKKIFPIDGTTMQGIGKQKIRKNNTSGIRGVSWCEREQMWRARLMFKRKEYNKYFKTKEEAIEYRKYLEELYYAPMIEKAKQQGYSCDK